MVAGPIIGVDRRRLASCIMGPTGSRIGRHRRACHRAAFRRSLEERKLDRREERLLDPSTPRPARRREPTWTRRDVAEGRHPHRCRRRRGSPAGGVRVAWRKRVVVHGTLRSRSSPAWRRSRDRTCAAEGLRRLQGAASWRRVGYPRAARRRTRVGSARARRDGVGRALDLVMIDGQHLRALGARWPARRPRRGPAGWPKCSTGYRSSTTCREPGRPRPERFPSLSRAGGAHHGPVLQQGAAGQGRPRPAARRSPTSRRWCAAGRARRRAAGPLLRRRLLQPVPGDVAAADDRGAHGRPTRLRRPHRSGRGRATTAPNGPKLFETIADLRTSGVLLGRFRRRRTTPRCNCSSCRARPR